MLSKSQSDVSLLVSRISISAAKAAGSIDSPVKTSPAKITPDSPVSWQIKRRQMDGGLTRMTPFALQEVVLGESEAFLRDYERREPNAALQPALGAKAVALHALAMGGHGLAVRCVARERQAIKFEIAERMARRPGSRAPGQQSLPVLFTRVRVPRVGADA